ncbi:MAG: hypothetical protein EZS28_013057, partial [Streblomastix strix]
IQPVDTIPNSDTVDVSCGTVESQARNDHSHPINVQTNASIIPIVNGVVNNGTSAYYSRHDHILPYQLTYDGNDTATKFIKSGGLATDILLANGDITAISDNFVSIATDQTITGQEGQADNGLRISTDGSTLTFNGDGLMDVGTDLIIKGNIQINPTSTGFGDGLKISRADPTGTGNSSIQLGCSRTSNSGAIEGQWSIFTPPSSFINNPQSFVTVMVSQTRDNTRGLQISADGNTLTFNCRVQ